MLLKYWLCHFCIINIVAGNLIQEILNGNDTIMSMSWPKTEMILPVWSITFQSVRYCILPRCNYMPKIDRTASTSKGLGIQLFKTIYYAFDYNSKACTVPVFYWNWSATGWSEGSGFSTVLKCESRNSHSISYSYSYEKAPNVILAVLDLWQRK